MLQVMQKARQTTDSIITRILHRLHIKMEFIREHLGDVLGLHPVYEGLVYTEEETGLINKTAEITVEFFTDSPGESLLEEDFESRCEALEDFGAQIAALYGLDAAEVIVSDDPDIFPDGNGVTYGKTVFTDTRVFINAACVKSDDEAVLEHVISTMIHEMRHLMQLQVIIMERDYGIPYHRRHAWRENMNNYIDGDYDYEGYFNQPVEFDARNFANRVWQNAYGKRIS